MSYIYLRVFFFLQFPELGPAETLSDTSDGEDQAKETHVTVCDINPAMLEVGKKRALELGYHKGKE